MNKLFSIFLVLTSFFLRAQGPFNNDLSQYACFDIAQGIIINNQFDKYTSLEIIRANSSFVTINTTTLDKYATLELVRAGGKVIVNLLIETDLLK